MLVFFDFILIITVRSNIYPVKTFILGEDNTFRSQSLQKLYPNLNATFVSLEPRLRVSTFDTPNCNKIKKDHVRLHCKKCMIKRHLKTAGVIMTAMYKSLSEKDGWFLALEDDALPTCTDYHLKSPIPEECEYISLDGRGISYVRSKKLSNEYFRSIDTKGHGTAGFWFKKSFAKYILDIDEQKFPIDIIIFNSAKNRGICFIKDGCVVKHNDSLKKRKQIKGCPNS